jgi:hypothetical protein
MPTPRPHIAVWKRALLVLAIIVALGVFRFGYSLYQIVHTKIPESYAAWTTGNLMVEYLATHTNQWPRGWEDLRSATNSLLEKGGCVYLPLDRLPQFVKIEWHTDTDRLLQAAQSNSNAKPHVISRLDGSPLCAMWGQTLSQTLKSWGT